MLGEATDEKRNKVNGGGGEVVDDECDDKKWTIAPLLLFIARHRSSSTPSPSSSTMQMRRASHLPGALSRSIRFRIAPCSFKASTMTTATSSSSSTSRLVPAMEEGGLARQRQTLAAALKRRSIASVRLCPGGLSLSF